MQERSRFIAPERTGTWLVVAFGTAMLAVVLSLWGLYEARLATAVTQTEIVKLHQRVQTLERVAPKPAPVAPAAAAPAPAK